MSDSKAPHSADNTSPSPPALPHICEPVLFTTLTHLARFDKTLIRWQALNRAGVHFAEDFPYASVQKGWSTKRKRPLPFLGSAQLTLTDAALIIHAQTIPPQQEVRTSLFNLLEQAQVISYENLHNNYSETVYWKHVTAIRWHIARPHGEKIGRIPATSHYILLERTDDHLDLLLQVAPPFAAERVALPTAQLAEYHQMAQEKAVAANNTLLGLLLAIWQAYIADDAEHVSG